jgi:hypothetical protein
MDKDKLKNSVYLLIVIGFIGYVWYYIASAPTIPEADIVSKTGIHTHPELEIYILGEKQQIKANLGITATGGMGKNIHTHDSTGVLHIEKPGLVTKEDTKLKKFFEVWGQPFNANCILNKCNSEEGKVKMTVNGQENTEFENYLMQDKDKIKIFFEKN